MIRLADRSSSLVFRVIKEKKAAEELVEAEETVDKREILERKELQESQ